MPTKNSLAIHLSKLKGFENPDVKLEQYTLDSEAASIILWTAFLNKDIENKTIADLGSGPGILAKGCLLLGAKKVYLVEVDKKAISIAQENIQDKNAVFINKDVKDFNQHVDVVIQNPPFGTKQKHADKVFLETAMKISDTIYSLHKLTSKGFINALSEDHRFKVEQVTPLKMKLGKTYTFHKKPKQSVELGLWILRKQKP